MTVALRSKEGLPEQRDCYLNRTATLTNGMAAVWQRAGQRGDTRQRSDAEQWEISSHNSDKCAM